MAATQTTMVLVSALALLGVALLAKAMTAERILLCLGLAYAGVGVVGAFAATRRQWAGMDWRGLAHFGGYVRQSAWVFLGVTSTELLTRFYAFVVAGWYGPIALASLAATQQLLRPVPLLASSWSLVARTDLARRREAGDWAGMARITVLTGIGGVVIAAAWALIIFAGWSVISHYLFGGKYAGDGWMVLLWGVAAAIGFGQQVVSAALQALPGIGDYTSGAISAIAFDIPAAAIDGNAERALARLFAIETPMPAAKPELRRIGESLVPPDRPGDFAQALMDLGATICTPRKPSCVLCPWRESCMALALGIAETLPRKAEKAVRPHRAGIAFWVVDGTGAVLLRRRVEKGLLGGMMEVPSTEWIVPAPSPSAATAAAPSARAAIGAASRTMRLRTPTLVMSRLRVTAGPGLAGRSGQRCNTAQAVAANWRVPELSRSAFPVPIPSRLRLKTPWPIDARRNREKLR